MPLGVLQATWPASIAFKLANVEHLFHLKPPYDDPNKFSKSVLTRQNAVNGCYWRGE